MAGCGRNRVVEVGEGSSRMRTRRRTSFSCCGPGRSRWRSTRPPARWSSRRSAPASCRLVVDLPAPSLGVRRRGARGGTCDRHRRRLPPRSRRRPGVRLSRHAAVRPGRRRAAGRDPAPAPRPLRQRRRCPLTARSPRWTSGRACPTDRWCRRGIGSPAVSWRPPTRSPWGWRPWTSRSPTTGPASSRCSTRSAPARCRSR